jgi:glycerol-3-phosphate O-acyltransferase
MTHKRRGITHGQLVHRITQMLVSLQRLGARIAAPVLDEAGRFREETLHETLRLFGDAGLLSVVDDGRSAQSGDDAIYAVPEERRIALEYHKNTILHFFVPSALIATALLALGDDVEREALRERVRTLSRLFKLEFMYRADADFEEIFGDAIESMRGDGEIEIVHGKVRRGAGAPGARVATYAEMLRTYFEAYRLATLSVRPLRDPKTAPFARKEWMKSTLALGQRRWLSGQTSLRESVSRPKIENALAALHDQGIVRTEGEVIRAGDKMADTWEQLDRMLVEHLLIE